MATGTQKHTPTPWRYRLAQGEVINGVKFGVWAITNYAGQEILRTSRGIVRYDEALANARFIVQACNSFEDLLADLEMVVYHDGRLTDGDWAQIRADIARATSPQA